MVLAGAQAIYLHTGVGDLATAAMTTDADLLLRRGALPDQPTVDEAMQRAGFAIQPGGQPGQWVGEAAVEVDLMVVPQASGRSSPGARSVRMPLHDNRCARPTDGLQPVLVDNAAHAIKSLNPDGDDRQFQLAVAGPAAVITARAIKLSERLADRAGRVRPKDALDIYRLLSELSVDELVRGYERHALDEHATGSSGLGLAELLARRREIASLAADAARGDPQVRRQCSALITELVDEVKLRCPRLLS